jgi:hypothetical protein
MEPKVLLNVDLWLALRIYFTFVFILLGYLEDRCCSSRVKFRLNRSEIRQLDEHDWMAEGNRPHPNAGGGAQTALWVWG